MIDVFIERGDSLIADLAGQPRRIDLAAIRAINRGISSAKTFMVREISRDIGLTSSAVRERLKQTNATLYRPSARLSSDLLRIPVIDFGARGPEPSRGKGKGVSWRAGARGRQTNPHAFIATVKGPLPSGVVSPGHRGIFERVGKGRLPIRQLFGPSYGHVFAKFRKPALERAREIFEKNFDHEMQFRGATAAPAE